MLAKQKHNSVVLAEFSPPCLEFVRYSSKLDGKTDRLREVGLFRGKRGAKPSGGARWCCWPDTVGTILEPDNTSRRINASRQDRDSQRLKANCLLGSKTGDPQNRGGGKSVRAHSTRKPLKLNRNMSHGGSSGVSGDSGTSQRWEVSWKTFFFFFGLRSFSWNYAAETRVQLDETQKKKRKRKIKECQKSLERLKLYFQINVFIYITHNMFDVLQNKFINDVSKENQTVIFYLHCTVRLQFIGCWYAWTFCVVFYWTHE